MVKHELPAQPEADSARVELRQTNEIDPLSNPELEEDEAVFEIMLGDQKIGQLELVLYMPDELVAIDWLAINEDLRGQGYGKQAREAALDLILSKYSWARTIQSTLTSKIALKNAISTPVPDGWTRKFLGTDSSQFETANSNEALDYMSPDDNVSWVLERQDKSTR